MTTINDKGEEVTEETWETDSEDDEPELAAPRGQGPLDGLISPYQALALTVHRSWGALVVLMFWRPQ